MNRTVVTNVLLAMIVLTGCRGGSSPELAGPDQLPTYTIVGQGVSGEAAAQLAAALGLSADIRTPNGRLLYLDTERLHALPMSPFGAAEPDEDGNAITAEAFDFAAIAALPVYSEADALDRAVAALSAANLVPPDATPEVAHSRFEAVTADGVVVADFEIDTQVIFRQTAPNGEPLVGPGAEVKIVFDGTGTAVQIVYAQRQLARGRDVPVLSLADANRLAVAHYLGTEVSLGAEVSAAQLDALAAEITAQQGCAEVAGGLEPAQLCLGSEVVYYAPPLSEDIGEIVPHYLYSATLSIGGETVEARRLLVPAAAVAPQVTIDAQVASNEVSATAQVTGGTPPYRYRWSSASSEIATADAPSVAYTVAGRQESEQETLNLLVTDANGLFASARRTLTLSSPPSPTQTTPPPTPAPLAVGTEWVGPSQGLNLAPDNVAGFVRRFAAGNVDVAFNLGEDRAFEADFVDADVAANGQDASYIDAVDLAFYTGHASGSGITFSTDQTSRFLFFDEARWGNQDLEWIIIAACGPLQDLTRGETWWERWGQSFDGLHLLLAYSTVTFDNNQEGGLFADYLLGSGYRLRHAWVQTATDVQGSDEIYAVMGVWGADGVTNYNDHFWNQGPVGPDVPGDEIEGFWRLTGPS
ncbi:MAG: DUF6345 domain-containing protein [Trueperaceae bacterium]|nr:DUF6345 domain-containing protein [Trueperaceae bacterium]